MQRLNSVALACPKYCARYLAKSTLRFAPTAATPRSGGPSTTPRRRRRTMAASNCARLSSMLTTSSDCFVTSVNPSNHPNTPRLVTRRTSNLRCCGASSTNSTSFVRDAALDPRTLPGWVMRRFLRNQTFLRTRQPQTLATMPNSPPGVWSNRDLSRSFHCHSTNH